MTDVDYEALLSHARVYDPVKAREYYLRTRQLKGRRTGLSTEPAPKSRVSGTNAPARKTKSSRRQEELRAQKAALERRLEKLKNSLALLVDAAKVRSGVESKPDPKETANDKADRNESSKKEKPLTAKQKKDKAAAAKEAYEKETGGGSSLSGDVAALQEQIKSVRAQLEAAIAAARRSSKRSSGRVTAKTSPATRTTIKSSSSRLN